MKSGRSPLAIGLLLLSLTLLATRITAAGGPGPKDGAFLPATPVPSVRALAQGPDFQKAAEEALRKYLGWYGPQNSLDRVQVEPVPHITGSNSWNTYTDPFWAFSLVYPPSWYLQNFPYRDFGFRLTSPDVEVDPLGRPHQGVLLSVMVQPILKESAEQIELPQEKVLQKRTIQQGEVQGFEVVGLDPDGNAYIERQLTAYNHLYRFRLIAARSFNIADFDAGIQILESIRLIGEPLAYPAPDYAEMGIDLTSFDFPEIKHAFDYGPGRIINGYESGTHVGGDDYALDICEGACCSAGTTDQYIIAPTRLTLVYSGPGYGMPSNSLDYHIFEIDNDGSYRLCMSLAHFQILLPGLTIGKSVPRGAALGRLVDYPPSSPHIHMGLWVVPAAGNCAGGNRTAVPYTGAYRLDGVSYPVGVNHSGTNVTSTNYGICAAPTSQLNLDIASMDNPVPNDVSGCFPQSPCPQAGGVILYQHANYDCGNQGEGYGYVVRSSAGFQNVPGTFNDKASSIRILSGWSVRLYEHSDRGGGKRCINAPGDSNFAGDTFDNGVSLNDNVSSFEVFAASDCAGGSPPDTTPPSGDYTSPANGATVGRTVRLAAWASDSGSGVREVHFTAKWSGNWRLVYNDTSAPYEYDWDLCASGVPDGDIELGLDIWDNAGNVFHLHTVHPNPHITKSYNCSAPGSTWSVDYWNNKYLAGYPNWHNNESGTYIFRDWGDGGPGGGIQVNEWSARFVRTVYFPGGNYRFHCHHDDGCRIFVDGQNCIDAWWDSSFEGHDCARDISPGNHEVRVEYYDNQGGARLEAWWQGPGFLPRDQTCDPNQWCAEYWGNRGLSGTPAIRRNEGDTLWHDWGSGGPDPTFPADNFSSRFVRNAYFTCGTYRFHVFADDGVKFWVDNVLRLDQWRDQVASYDVDLTLSSGAHSLKVEHYENGGGAAIRLTWEKRADCQPNVTVEYASTHYARPGAAVDPVVRVRVTSGYLDGRRQDNLSLVGGPSLGAATTQPVYGTVNEGSTYTFDVVNSTGFRMTAPSTEGTYDSRWRVKAAGSLIGPEATVRVIVDGTPPTIAIQNPTQGAFLNTSAVTVRATPQDAGGIDQVQFFVGYNSGSGWAWYNLGWDLDGSDGWSRVWDASGVPDQRGVAFYAYAWDRAGNGAGAAVWDVTLDRTPPTTAIRPLAATQDSTAFIVWWDASDNAAGIDHLDLQKRRDGGAWEDWHLGVGSQYVGAWFVGEMGHRYGFRMRGVDRAGNAEAYPGGPEAETYINFCSGDPYEADNGPAQARSIALGQSQAHNFCGVDDEDWVKFQVRAGKRYVLETGSLGFATDTVLTLYDSDGATVLTENDDIAYPENLASRVEWKAQRDGWLYARVRHYDGRVAGNAVTYTLRLEEGYRVYLPTVLRNR